MNATVPTLSALHPRYRFLTDNAICQALNTRALP